jgi:hypothetical protein
MSMLLDGTSKIVLNGTADSQVRLVTNSTPGTQKEHFQDITYSRCYDTRMIMTAETQLVGAL